MCILIVATKVQDLNFENPMIYDTFQKQSRFTHKTLHILLKVQATSKPS